MVIVGHKTLLIKALKAIWTEIVPITSEVIVAHLVNYDSDYKLWWFLRVTWGTGQHTKQYKANGKDFKHAY